MDRPEIELDHIGIAVSQLAQSYAFWKLLGWQEDSQPEEVPDQKVSVGMLPLQNSAQIELLEPVDEDSPIAKFIAKRGPGIHHICLRVKNIDEILKKLKAANVRL